MITKSFLYLAALLLCLSSAYAYTWGYDHGLDSQKIRSCVESIPKEDFSDLRKLYFSSSESYEFSRTCDKGNCVINGATGLYIPWQRKIAVYNNDDFCLILRHELCHLKQDMNKKPFDEEECSNISVVV